MSPINAKLSDVIKEFQGFFGFQNPTQSITLTLAPTLRPELHPLHDFAHRVQAHHSYTLLLRGPRPFCRAPRIMVFTRIFWHPHQALRPYFGRGATPEPKGLELQTPQKCLVAKLAQWPHRYLEIKFQKKIRVHLNQADLFDVQFYENNEMVLFNSNTIVIL